MPHWLLVFPAGLAFDSRRGKTGAEQNGEVPATAFGVQGYWADWMGTAESQRALRYERYGLKCQRKRGRGYSGPLRDCFLVRAVGS